MDINDATNNLKNSIRKPVVPEGVIDMGNRCLTPEKCRNLEKEVSTLKLEIKQIHKDYGFEVRDPNGTIWEHAEKMRVELGKLRSKVEEQKIQIEMAVKFIYNEGDHTMFACSFCQKSDECSGRFELEDCTQAIISFLLSKGGLPHGN